MTGIVPAEVMCSLSAWIENFSGGGRETASEKPVVLVRNPKLSQRATGEPGTKLKLLLCIAIASQRKNEVYWQQ